MSYSQDNVVASIENPYNFVDEKALEVEKQSNLKLTMSTNSVQTVQVEKILGNNEE